MNRRQRLMATLRGESVDRPALSFYELNGLDENSEDKDPFNIYSDSSWKPLIELTREKTDRIVMRGVAYSSVRPDPLAALGTTETFLRDGSRYSVQRIATGGRTLTSRTRRDSDTNTVWTEEHLLKDLEDLQAFLSLPIPEEKIELETQPVLDAEAALGDAGIVMIDTPDPLCMAASLFSMAEYTITAMTEPDLFRQLLDRFAASLLPRTVAAAEALPGRLWRIYGPEYACPPYLPPHLFREYVCAYVKPMIEAIHKHGGFVRLHAHGRIKDVLDDIVAMGAMAIDPLEPPPQGDVELSYVRERYGKDLVLFGNLEISEIECMPTEQFAEKVKRALEEGTSGSGRGFVLMPSACPYGRKLSALTLKNYEKIVEILENF
jgi:Uroporphyrinogen decarboxylase (URO-D)